MSHTRLSSSVDQFQDQLAEIQEIMEREKVEFSPEVQKYLDQHIQRITEMVGEGQMLAKEDLEFFKDVKIWMESTEDIRQQFSSIESMEAERIEADKRHISLRQWLDLIHMAHATAAAPQRWYESIDQIFQFPGQGKIKTKEGLYIDHCTSLARLPENLSIDGDLNLSDDTSLTHLPDNLSVLWILSLDGCISLTHLPKSLLIGGDLDLSENLNQQVKDDAERMQKEGKVKGGIFYH